MSLSKKRPTFLRFILCLFIGLLISGGLLMAAQPYYEEMVGRSILREPFFIIAGISALLIALFLVFPTRRPWRLFKWVGRLLLLVILVALVFGIGSLYQAQNDMIYHPGLQEVQAEAALADNPQVEELTITMKDGTALHGYLYRPNPEYKRLVLYFGGNGEPAAARIYSLVRENAGTLLGEYAFMMVDYPGYGKSGGEPEEASILAMAGATMEYAASLPGMEPGRIVLAGWSLGSGPASYLAQRNTAAGLILLTPFYNGRELVNGFVHGLMEMPDAFYTRLPGFLVRNKFDNAQHARTTTIPALVIGAQADNMIPFTQQERLAGEYTNGNLVRIAGGHSSPWIDPVSLQAIGVFLQQLEGGLPAVPATP